MHLFGRETKGIWKSYKDLGGPGAGTVEVELFADEFTLSDSATGAQLVKSILGRIIPVVPQDQMKKHTAIRCGRYRKSGGRREEEKEIRIFRTSLKLFFKAGKGERKK